MFKCWGSCERQRKTCVCACVSHHLPLALPRAEASPWANVQPCFRTTAQFIKIGTSFFPRSGCWYRLQPPHAPVAKEVIVPGDAKQAPQNHEEWRNADLLRSLQAAGTQPCLCYQDFGRNRPEHPPGLGTTAQETSKGVWCWPKGTIGSGFPEAPGSWAQGLSDRWEG